MQLYKLFALRRAQINRSVCTYLSRSRCTLATKWLRILSIPPNDKIRNHLVANRQINLRTKKQKQSSPQRFHLVRANSKGSSLSRGRRHVGIVQAWEGVAGARNPGKKDERMGCRRGGAERAPPRLSRPLSFPSRRGNVDTRPPAIPLSDTSTTIAERIFRRAQATTANYQPPNARVERGTSTTTKEKASPSRPKEKLRARAHAPPAATGNTRCV